MADKDKATSTAKTAATGAAPDDASAGQDRVDARMAEEQARGYRGVKVDPTPDEHYTVRGVTRGLPTPETDPQQAAAADARVEQVGEALGDPPRLADLPDAPEGEGR